MLSLRYTTHIYTHIGSEVVKTHAVARIMLSGYIDNIQVSWVKEGFRMAQMLLNSGANDIGMSFITFYQCFSSLCALLRWSIDE